MNITAHVAKTPIKVGKSSSKNELPEIKEGDPCDPGKTYKMDCNRCQCTNNGKLLCTKMACYNPNDYKPVLRSRHGKANDLPKAPKGPCIPGIVYQNGCNACICDDKEQIHCGTGKCNKNKRVLFPDDLHEPLTDAEFEALETRESFSSECTPGKSYRLNCNLCFCNEMRNLICNRYACLSFDAHTVNRITAYENIGKLCEADQKYETENTCINCTCVDGKTQCNWQKECEDINYKQKLEKTIKLQKINPETDVCVPGGLYLIFCNRCHCMLDGALRCTQMTCLNYSQAQELRKEHEFLERNGL